MNEDFNGPRCPVCRWYLSETGRCEVCGAVVPKGDGWPTASGGCYCQVCWEDECASQWWEFLGGSTDEH